MKTKLVIALLALGMLTGTLMAATPARGAPTLTLAPPKYGTSGYYVPGEVIEFTVNVLAADPRVWDIAVIWDNGTPPIVNVSLNAFDNVNVPSPANSITLTYTLPSSIPDGDHYYLVVGDSGWLDSGMTVGEIDRVGFRVRTWQLTVNLSKTRYLPGDSVTVSYSANMIKDGSLAPVGNGFLWVYDTGPGVNQFVPTAEITSWPVQFGTAQGTFTFTLLGGMLTTHQIRAYAWFNSTDVPATRFMDATSNAATIDGLRMLVNVAATFQPGAVVPVTIGAKITDAAPNVNNPGAAGTVVAVTVTNQLTGRVEGVYGASGLIADAHGNLVYAFKLNSTGIADGTDFLVTVNGVAHGDVVATAGMDTFTVQSSLVSALVLTVDKATYLSGDTVTLTASVSGLPGPFTYTYQAHDGAAGGPLLDQKTSTSPYTYSIALEFDGTITFVVTAADADGNHVGPANRAITVYAGIVAVNLDRVEYNGGDTITATYELKSNAISLSDPTVHVFYEVKDATVVPAVLVKSGNVTPATTGSLQFVVPAVPSDHYAFTVTVTEEGRSIISTPVDAYLVRGYFLSVVPDKASYVPGDTITFTYELASRSARDPLPSAFLIQIQIPGLNTKSAQVTSTRGTVTYPLPQGMNTGLLRITVTASFVTGTVTAEEIVTISAVNPLMADVGGVPAISVILLLLVIVILIVLAIMWRRMAPGMAGAPKPPTEKPTPPPPPTAAPGPAPMTVACKACGAKIEITTSKRPIEVMCPSCGETQMVQ